MSVPGIVQSALGDAELVERVPLGGDDELFVTSAATIVYRGDGLLSDESVEEYPHDADQLSISESRRKTTFELEYALQGTKSFAVPADATDDVLHPVLAGLLSGNGVTDAGERVVRTYRFSELTVVVTSDRLVKHVGGAVWATDCEVFDYADVTGLSFEAGSVATQVVLEVDGRQRRIKAPNEEAPNLRERLQQAVFDYHDVDSLEALNEKVGREDGDDGDDGATVDFGEGVDPLGAESSGGSTDEAAAPGGPDSTGDAPTVTSSDEAEVTAGGATSDVGTDQRETTGSDGPGSGADAAASGSDTDGPEFGSSGFEPAETLDRDELAVRIDSLEATIERQTELLERQQRTIEQLVDELQRGR